MQKDDLISRQAALDALGERPAIWSYNDDYTLGERNQYDMDRLAIETVPPAQQGWIPTSKKPPEPFKLVLIQDSYGVYDLAMYIPPRIKPKQYPNGYWLEVDGVDYDYFDVYAWHPLPKKYRPEGEDRGESGRGQE